ncbi:MAG: hypothetical protein LAT83_09515 [Kiritimatiellae bacterium]|nr:hypothetical protein [Kiritimatiellia bacterium]
MSTTESNPQSTGEFLLYTTEDGKSRVECRFENETIWLSQKLMADLFEVEVPTVNEHLKTLYESGEIDPESTIRKFRIVRPLFTCRKTGGSRTFSMRLSVTRSPGFPDNCRLRKIGWGSNPQVRHATLRGVALFGSGIPWIEIHGYASDVATRRTGIFTEIRTFNKNIL